MKRDVFLRNRNRVRTDHTLATHWKSIRSKLVELKVETFMTVALPLASRSIRRLAEEAGRFQ
jgi:hypothetical protein